MKYLGDRMAAFGSRLPVDFVVTVASNIFAQLFKFPSFADLPLSVQPEAAAIEKQSGQVLPFREQVRINADLRLGRHPRADSPEPDRRSTFDIDSVEKIIAAL